MFTTHASELTCPIDPSSGLFLRFPTTFPTLDSLNTQGRCFSAHRAQPDLLASHFTCNSQHGRDDDATSTYFSRKALVASATKLDRLCRRLSCSNWVGRDLTGRLVSQHVSARNASGLRFGGTLHYNDVTIVCISVSFQSSVIMPDGDEGV